MFLMRDYLSNFVAYSNQSSKSCFLLSHPCAKILIAHVICFCFGSWMLINVCEQAHFSLLQHFSFVSLWLLPLSSACSSKNKSSNIFRPLVEKAMVAMQRCRCRRTTSLPFVMAVLAVMAMMAALVACAPSTSASSACENVTCDLRTHFVTSDCQCKELTVCQGPDVETVRPTAMVV